MQIHIHVEAARVVALRGFLQLRYFQSQSKRDTVYMYWNIIHIAYKLLSCHGFLT